MPQPYNLTQHISSRLTNMAVANFQDPSAFIADKVFPTVDVKKEYDQYVVYNMGDFNRDEAQLRADGVESEGGGYSLSDDSYRCRVYAFHKDVTARDRANSDSPLDADMDALQLITHKMLIKREKIFTTNFFGSGIWGTDVTGVASGQSWPTSFLQWNDDSSTPVKDMFLAKQIIGAATGLKPNTLIAGPQVMSALKNNPDIIERLVSGGTSANPATTTNKAIAEIFELDNIYEPWAVINSAKEGQTASTSYMYGKAALLLYVNPNRAQKKAATAGRIFAWNGYLGAKAYGIRIARIPMNHLGIGTQRIEGEMAFDSKVIASNLGVYFASAVA